MVNNECAISDRGAPLPEKEAAFVDDLIATLQTTGSLPTGTAFSAATLLSKMIANMNTEDGVQYNFSNANAWYICLGAKYGGLIIQGGKISVSQTTTWTDITLPINSYTLGILATATYRNWKVAAWGDGSTTQVWSENTGSPTIFYVALCVIA